MSEQPDVLTAEHVVKVFRDFWRRPKVKAVDGVTFTVRRGEVFGLLGPNGSGKTTTLKMILGLLYPTSGLIRVLGRSPRNVRAKERVGYLPEESSLYPFLTCEETLDFFGRMFDLNAGERRRRTEQLLEMIGLRHARRRLVGEFSKGMARRIGLAQALINDPDLVVLDEPTSGLDPLGCRQVKDLILTLARRGKTVILSSHLLADVEDVCDRVVILYNGRIQAEGPVAELLEERGRYRLTVPEMPPEQWERLLAAVRTVLAEDPVVDHPRRDLEGFFLDVVARARRGVDTPSGAAGGEAMAEYLAAPEPAADRLLERLAAPAAIPPPPAEEPPEPEPTPEEPAAPVSDDADRRLRRLVNPGQDGHA